MRLLTLNSVIFICFLSVSAMAQTAVEGARLVVIGSGAASAAPDQAIISLGARHFGKTATEALSQTSTDTAAILARLQAAGVAAQDMQTASLNLRPVWDEYARDKAGEPLPPTGFEASNQITATLRDLGNLGSLLDQVAREGANALSGFRFGIADQTPLEAEARSAAIADARMKAEQYARDAGVTLGGLVLITEQLGGGGDFGPPVMEMAAARSAPVPIAAGEITVRRSVKVIFEIK